MAFKIDVLKLPFPCLVQITWPPYCRKLQSHESKLLALSSAKAPMSFTKIDITLDTTWLHFRQREVLEQTSVLGTDVCIILGFQFRICLKMYFLNTLFLIREKESISHSVVSASLQPYGL